MNNDLYFLPIIARAISASDPGPAFKKAFQEINAIGGNPGFGIGYCQFKQFMDKAIEQMEYEHQWLEDLQTTAVKDLVLQLAAGLFEEGSDEFKAVREGILSRKTWREAFEKLCSETLKFQEDQWVLELIVIKDGNRIGSYPLKHADSPIRVASATPGFYALQLSNGRNLWQGKITEQDLLWASAFPERNLKMAADTEGLSLEPTRKIKLLDGELILRVFPAIESGWIEIERRGLH